MFEGSFSESTITSFMTIFDGTSSITWGVVRTDDEHASLGHGVDLASGNDGAKTVELFLYGDP